VAKPLEPSLPFRGFPDFRANVTFVPTQFFTTVIPWSSRGTIRIVGYALRRILGWVDQNGNLIHENLPLSYRELIEKAGVSRGAIGEAIAEAVGKHLLKCLETPSPSAVGSAGRSGVYTLCWDDVGPYTDDPDKFSGFYYPAAAVIEEHDGNRTVRRPKSARKNIPNAFFDYLLPRESLAVIRVVGALMFYSIQWGPGGERKQPVSRSITELCALTKLSRRHVHAAVIEAQRRGYIVRLEPGDQDFPEAQEPQSATYGIRWNREIPRTTDPPPVQKGIRHVGARYKKGNAGPVQKGERNQSKMENEKESKKVNAISIKRDSKKQTTAAAVEAVDAAVGTISPEEVDIAFAALVNVGFDEAGAKQLARSYPADVILRQISWLPHRAPPKNPRGFLRKAIQEDWASPVPAAQVNSRDQGARLFAGHYYAAYHGFQGDAATHALAKDVEASEVFLGRLLGIGAVGVPIQEWARRFGRLVRGKHQNDPKARPSLFIALAHYGDHFLAQIQAEAKTRRAGDQAQARQAHEKIFRPAYRAYLVTEESRLQADAAAEYERFREHRAELRNSMTGSTLRLSPVWFTRFDSEEARLDAFAEFFDGHPRFPVLDFWEWDQRVNSHRGPKTEYQEKCQ